MNRSVECALFDLGSSDYADTQKLQLRLVEAVRAGRHPAALILVRHEPVITTGRRLCAEAFKVPIDDLASFKVDLYRTQRGGSVTYHGPGQQTVYPVFNLRYLRCDLHWYLRQLEEVFIRLLSSYNIGGSRREGFTGVWAGGRKIVSIGIAVRDWVTFHGASLVVHSSELTGFRMIKPCGFDIEMAALEELTNCDISFTVIKERIVRAFEEVFSISCRSQAH